MADLLKRLQISEQQYGVGMEDNPFQDASPDECMNVCFGGSGGGGSPPPPPPQTMHQQTSNIPEYFQPYLERLFDRGEAVTTEPFQRYEGQRLAEVSPQQQTAYQGVEEMVGGYKPYIGTADVLTAQASQQSTDPTAVASRMSPYQQSVVDIQKREALRDANKLQQQIGAAATGAGAYGGSRQALQETELARQTGQRLADIQAVGSQQAYQQAMNQLSADRAASLAAGQQFAGLGAQQQQLGLAGLGALETVGGTQQAQKQKALDIGYEDFARETTYPQQQLQEMSSLLRGFNLPVSTYTTSQTQQAPATFGQQAANLGLGALGIYGAGKGVGLFNKGGKVEKYASKGSVGGIYDMDNLTMDPVEQVEIMEREAEERGLPFEIPSFWSSANPIHDRMTKMREALEDRNKIIESNKEDRLAEEAENTAKKRGYGSVGFTPNNLKTANIIAKSESTVDDPPGSVDPTNIQANFNNPISDIQPAEPSYYTDLLKQEAAKIMTQGSEDAKLFPAVGGVGSMGDYLTLIGEIGNPDIEGRQKRQSEAVRSLGQRELAREKDREDQMWKAITAGMTDEQFRKQYGLDKAEHLSKKGLRKQQGEYYVGRQKAARAKALDSPEGKDLLAKEFNIRDFLSKTEDPKERKILEHRLKNIIKDRERLVDTYLYGSIDPTTMPDLI